LAAAHSQRRCWVTSDKTHVEHNESALALIADIPGDIDFRCNGPTADIGSATSSRIKELHPLWAPSQ